MSAYRPPVAKKSAPKNRATAISAARKAAFAVLMAVERGHSHSDELLRTKSIDSLSAPDRHLATALVLGVLRWQIRLDHQLQALLKRPNGKLDPEILIALRLGAFQILFMDRIPARAAIDESVELAKQAGHRFASSMVNAVLRKVQAKASTFQHMEATAEELALEQAHPVWMVERWAHHFGLEAAQGICIHGQSQPVAVVRLASSAVEAELVAAGIRLAPGQLLASARALVSGDLAACPAFVESRVRLQDEGSQLVAELACGGSKAERVLDACAAPGGKTLILAERNPLARILACESSVLRHQELQRRLATLAERVECRCCDGTALHADPSFDLALADVPCSGTGTLGRNPEIRHRLRPEELHRQAARQQAILTAVFDALRPGGRVLYSTCSLEPEENEAVVAAVLALRPHARLLSLASRIDALEAGGVLALTAAERLHSALTAQGCLRLLPGSFQTDGFFVAMLLRESFY